MYFNTEFLVRVGLKIYDVLPLQLIKQNASKDKDYSKEIEAYVGMHGCRERIENKGLITFIKGKKGDTEYQKIRLSKKGKETLRLVEVSDVTDDDYVLREDLVKIWQSLGHKVGNKEKLIRDLCWFRTQVFIDNAVLLQVIKAYIDHCEEYVPNLENLFWKPATRYSTSHKLSESKLYQFVEEKLNHLL